MGRDYIIEKKDETGQKNYEFKTKAGAIIQENNPKDIKQTQTGRLAR
jgi:hypothetical protein